MSNTKGFTLVEVLVVIVIIAALAAIAVPSYRDYVVKAKRSDAKAMLLTLASQQERYFYDENIYASTTESLGYAAATVESEEGNYDLSIVSPTTTSYTLQAVPKGSQLSQDKECGTLTINSVGQKTESGTGSVDDCW